jgi:hypothetical protein
MGFKIASDPGCIEFFALRSIKPDVLEETRIAMGLPSQVLKGQTILRFRPPHSQGRPLGSHRPTDSRACEFDPEIDEPKLLFAGERQRYRTGATGRKVQTANRPFVAPLTDLRDGLWRQRSGIQTRHGKSPKT